MIFRCLFLVLCAVAALRPLATPQRAQPAENSAIVWPATFEGRPLQRIPLNVADQRFNAGFPGEIARFSDGERDLIFRWITRPSRKVHSSSYCLRGLGYAVQPAPAWQDGQGARWSCFTAVRPPYRLHVRERIVSSTSGETWIDVSSWYWNNVLQDTGTPWIAITVVENQ